MVIWVRWGSYVIGVVGLFYFDGLGVGCGGEKGGKDDFKVFGKSIEKSEIVIN